MPKFSAPLDLTGNELRNAVTQNLGTAPGVTIAGLRYFDTVLGFERYWNGTKWIDVNDTLDASNITGLGDLALLDQVGAAEIAPGSIDDSHISATAAIDLAKLAIDPLDRANHTGTQLAATISDFDTQVRTNPINLLATPTASLDMGNQTITNVATPSLASDAVNKAYADSMAAGIDVKASVRVASTGDINVAVPGGAIDGVSLNAGDRVLLKNQADPVQNGIYIFNGSATAMTRSPDADQDAEVKSGMYCLVTNGAAGINTGWMLTTPNPITVGTTPLTFEQFSAGGTQYVGTMDRITVTGNQINIASNYAGQVSIDTVGTIASGTWQGTPVDIAYGGTGATTAAQARINLGVASRPEATVIGNGTLKTFDVSHSFATKDVGVEIFEVSTGQTVYADVRRPDTTKVTIDGFATAPGNGALRVVIWG